LRSNQLQVLHVDEDDDDDDDDDDGYDDNNIEYDEDEEYV